MPLSIASLDDVINHVFLPPKLPQSAESIPDDSDQRMLEVTIQSLKDFSTRINDTLHKTKIVTLANALSASRRIYGGADSISESSLRDSLKEISTGSCELLLVHVRAQNAGVLISKEDAGILFETFELSAQNKDVMSTAGRLVRTLPGYAITVCQDTFDDVEFHKTVASTLAKMSIQSVPGMLPQSSKSGKKNDEERDTTHPGIVTELFFAGFLRAIGTTASVTTIQKQTRDEVLWRQALRPWRRSPMWFLIRCTLQLVLSRAFLDGDWFYKECMVFVHSSILEQALRQSQLSDKLHCMNAKIVRRLQKLSTQGTPVLHAARAKVQEILKQSAESLQERWSTAQKAGDLNLSQLSSLDFTRDTLMSLPEVDEYIEALRARSHSSMSTPFSPVTKLVTYDPSKLPKLDHTYFSDADYAFANLLEFEKWVSSQLSHWLSGELANNANGSQCAQLGDLIRQYHHIAVQQYSNNPEANSTMLLTLFELWIACDKAATANCQLLSTYKSVVPYRVLQSLLLPRKDQMERLREVEKYLALRCDTPLRSADMLFSCDSTSSFAVQYFDSSIQHQRDMADIKAQASRARQQKLRDFDRLKQQFELLMNKSQAIAECKYTEKCYDRAADLWHSVHQRDCQKCQYRDQASNLTIAVNEWALPSNEINAKVVVFELQVPSWFAHWRDTFVYLLDDILGGKYDDTAKPRASYLLCDHKQLANRYAKGLSRRIDLLSQDKPYVVTHYREKFVGKTNKDEVCAPNGCKYQYFDMNAGTFFGSFKFGNKTEELCTYQFPSHSKVLQKYISRPAASPSGPAPNYVLANLHECPPSMALDEYRDLCTIPLGYNIQWQNILSQIGMTSVDLRKPETVLVFMQCIYQAGPPLVLESLRESHRILDDVEFAVALLSKLEDALQKVKENWESSNAVCIFAAIATRLLSLSGSSKIQGQCLNFLSRARTTAFSWVDILRNKAQQAGKQEDRTTFVGKAMEVALICGVTFDLDDIYLTTVLAEELTASMLWQCSIALQEGQGGAPGGRLSNLLAARFRSVLYRCCTGNVRCHVGLDDAVSKSWSAYCSSGPWTLLGKGADHWLTTNSRAVHDGKSMSVYYNTLTGELLVDGVPLGGAPKAYQAKPLFVTLFGHAAIEVMPTPVSGMQFSVKKSVQGCTVHLSLDSAPQCKTTDLLVQAHVDGKVYETIPERLLEGHFPRAFTTDYVHWYDTSSGEIFFRSREKPWDSTSSATWTLSKSKGKWQLTRNRAALVATNSKTSKTIWGALAPLVTLDRIHCILDASGNQLEAEIPNLKLGFHVAQGRPVLSSREFKGMVIDTDTSLGTFIGLENKVMLRHSKLGNRMVLIPQGKVSYNKYETHVRVKVDPETIKTFHSLKVDVDLGRLVDNGSFDCKIYVACLHALTAFCLPDRLTQKTGTEQAITILQSAAVRSFDQLTQAQVDMLVLIATIAPTREFYPQHERVMQTVAWDPNLSFLAQHVGLYEAVKAIFLQWERMRMFFPDSEVEVPRVDRMNGELLGRDQVRTAMFRVSGFGAEDDTTSQDVVYASRDRAQESKRASNAFILAKLIECGVQKLHWDAPRPGSLWEMFRRQNEVFGPQHTIPWAKLRYDGDWTQDCEVWICKHFAALHKSLGSRDEHGASTFDLMMWLSTLTWSSNVDLSMLQTLALLLIKGGSIAQASVPSDSDVLHPMNGNAVDLGDLQRLVNDQAYPIHQCPEAHWTRSANQSREAFSRKRQQEWSSNRQTYSSRFAYALFAQGLREDPSTPTLSDISLYFNVEKVMQHAKAKFKIWFDNCNFSEYLRKLEVAVVRLGHEPIAVPRVLSISPAALRGKQKGFLSANDLFAQAAPELLHGCPVLNIRDEQSASRTSHNSPRLEALVQQLKRTTNGSVYETEYVKDLEESMQSLTSIGNEQPQYKIDASELGEYLQACERYTSTLYKELANAAMLAAGQYALRTSADTVKHCPRISPMFFLEQLSHRRWKDLPCGWKKRIVQYALSLCALQRAKRIEAAANSPADLAKELHNPGHQGWQPRDHPDSLLMEVESGILIRGVQEEIASHMRSPPDGRNSVMQLNMGEGKSSVIVPIVAAALADRDQLVRVVVAKPQSKQMAQMLISKLGGLLGRRVYYLPFSRSLKISASDASALESLCRECMSEGGVLLVQPEHILSFKLMAPECYITGRDNVGEALMRTQDFFDRCSRDIVDESDENFSVKFELIYTMGMQEPIEMAPERWTLLQQVLQLARKLLPKVLMRHPKSVETQDRVNGSFPRLRILDHEGGDYLVALLAEHICSHGLEGFAIARQP